MAIPELPIFIKENYEIHDLRHASAILSKDFPDEWYDIIDVLLNFRLYKSWITKAGGRKSPIAQSIDDAFYSKGWVEKTFETVITVDGTSRESPALNGGAGGGCPILVFGISKGLFVDG